MDSQIKKNDTQSYTIALPYLSILPLNQQALDVTILDKVRAGLSQEIVDYLLGNSDKKAGPKELIIDLQSNESKDKDQQSFLKEIKKSFSAFQDQKATTSFGYPMVVVTDYNLAKPVAAPLFFWEVNLVEVPNETDQWKLDLVHAKGKINGILKSYLTTRLNLDWENEIGLINDITPAVVTQVCERIAEGLNFDLKKQKEENAENKNAENKNVEDNSAEIENTETEISKTAIDSDEEIAEPTEQIVDSSEEEPTTKNIAATTERDITEEKTPNLGTDLVACPNPYAALQTGVFYHLVLGHLSPSGVQQNEKMPTPIVGRPTIHWQTKIAAMPSNSEQNELMGTLFEGNHVVVEGNEGSGKTHTIANILASVLVDGGNALIVSPYQASANEIRSHLEKLGLDKVAAIQLFEEDLDKLKLIERLAKLPESIQNIKLHDSATYSKKLNKHQNIRRQLEQTYDAVRVPIFEDKNWTELVGLFLRHQQNSPKQWLNRKLDTSYYEFTHTELEIVGAELAEHYEHYSQINVLTHGLNALNSRFFVPVATQAKSREAANAAINLCHHKTKTLYHAHLALLDDYASFLKLERIDFADNLEQQLNKIINDLNLYEQLYGDNFDKQTTLQNAKLKFLGIFSRKYQEIAAAKEQLLADFAQLKFDYEQQQDYVAIELPDIQKENSLAAIESKLEDFKAKLSHWKTTIAPTIDAEVDGLLPTAVLPEQFGEQQEKLNNLLKELTDFINQSQILKEPVAYEVSDSDSGLHNNNKYLLKLSMQFQKLENLWQDFDAYFNWRKSWLAISKETQKAVQALVYTNNPNWVDSFRSWYLHHWLSEYYNADLPNGEFEKTLPYAIYEENLEGVQQKIAEKALHVTYERQTKQIRRIKKEKDITLTNAAPLFKNKSLRNIVEWLGVAHFGEIFPIVMMSPEVAQNVLGGNKALFDLVITENSQTITAKTGTQLLKLANQQIVLGKVKKEADKDSLLAWMLAQQGRRYQYLQEMHSKEEEPVETFSQVSTPKPNAFQLAMAGYLSAYIDSSRILLNQSVEGVLVDIVISPEANKQMPLAIICDGGLQYQGKYDFELAMNRIQVLQSNAYLTTYVWSVEWWKNTNAAFEKLLIEVLEWDKKKLGATKTNKVLPEVQKK